MGFIKKILKWLRCTRKNLDQVIEDVEDTLSISSPYFVEVQPMDGIYRELGSSNNS
tara:strand:- start:1069 stop:1236 length:168 start_codon:yes stop_codon:yes gene_type:complete